MDEPEAAQVLAAFDVGAANLRRECRRFRLDGVGPLGGKFVGADRDVDRHPRQHAVPQHVLDDADWRVSPRRRLGDARHDVVAVVRLGARVGRDEDVVVDPRVVGTHERDPALAPQTSDHLADATLDDLDQRPLAPAVAIHLLDPGYHPVAVHQRAHLPRGEEQIGARVVGLHESEPVAVTDDASGHEVHPVDEPELAAAIADELAVALHGAQSALERLLRGRGPKCVSGGNPRKPHGRAASGQELDQRGAFGKVRDALTGTAGGLAARTWRAR